MYILLVDDKQAVLDNVRPLLEQNGHVVETAPNGLAAYEKALQEPFDLYIVDHLMPVMNGLQLSKNLLSNPLTVNTPIIFMTTQNTLEISSLTQPLRFQAIIAKPIDVKCLLDAINQTNEKNTNRFSL